MNQHIIVAGVPRAGKSTAARRLSQLYGFHYLSMDAVISGFEQNFPETQVNTYAPMPSWEILCHISGKIAPFLRTMLSRSDYRSFSRGLVIDMYQLLPADYVQFLSDPQLDCGICYFLTSNVTAQERARILTQYDTPQDYSYFFSPQQREENCVYMVEQSRLLRKMCESLGLAFVETAYEREKVVGDWLRSFH